MKDNDILEKCLFSHLRKMLSQHKNMYIDRNKYVISIHRKHIVYILDILSLSFVRTQCTCPDIGTLILTTMMMGVCRISRRSMRFVLLVVFLHVCLCAVETCCCSK